MPDEFLTVAEVAELLKLNQQTIRNMIDRGELGMCASASGVCECGSRS
jgi:excisionase family DNA binding protein